MIFLLILLTILLLIMKKNKWRCNNGKIIPRLIQFNRTLDENEMAHQNENPVALYKEFTERRLELETVCSKLELELFEVEAYIGKAEMILFFFLNL